MISEKDFPPIMIVEGWVYELVERSWQKDGPENGGYRGVYLAPNGDRIGACFTHDVIAINGCDFTWLHAYVLRLCKRHAKEKQPEQPTCGAW